MHKKNLIRGTLILGLAGIVAKFLGFFFRIPLIYMIGEEGIGLYQLTYPLYTFLLAIAAGVPIAVSKMISERIALNKRKEANNIFKVSLIMLGTFGLASSFLLLVFSKNIINAFDWSKDAYYSLIGISFAPLFTCLLSAYRGYFQGLQYMSLPASSQILEQITRVLVGVGLAYLLLQNGIAVAAGGASFGAAAGAAIGLLWLTHNYSKNKLVYPKEQQSRSLTEICFEMIRIAIPISLGQTIGSIMALIDSMMVPGLLKMSGYAEQTATMLYGQLTGKAMVLINVPLTLSIALAQSTVPVISEAHALNNRKRFEKNVKIAYKTAMILAMPCAAGLYTLARPILNLVFRGMGDGWELMQILSMASIFIIIAQTSTSILNGIGRTFLPIVAMILGCIVKVIISIIFIPIPEFNIRAAAYGTLLSYGIAALIDFILVIKCTRVYIDIREIFLQPMFCTLIMAFSVVLVYKNVFNLLSSNNKASLVSIAAGGFIYLVMLLITKTLSIKEFKAILRNG
jgi:stage V sporulation protein B